ncbi:MAG TPA: hypothetical protein VGT61_02265, partial [Thermomicrobiales bacterium]|nr:hypothetical protein [Thermomicrobiales bacterium]
MARSRLVPGSRRPGSFSALRWLHLGLVGLLLALVVGTALPQSLLAQEGSPSASPGPSASTASSPSQVNAELILDSSGSMAEATSDGEPRI